MPSEPPNESHSLLVRQLRRAHVSEAELQPNLRKLLDAVNAAYHELYASRQLLERSLDLSSQELRALLEQKSAAEKQMEHLHAQRLEATGLLAGGVAHDFNNLLAIIKGSCEVLVKLTEPGDVRRELVHQIESAASRASALTKQLMAFS